MDALRALPAVGTAVNDLSLGGRPLRFGGDALIVSLGTVGGTFSVLGVTVGRVSLMSVG